MNEQGRFKEIAKVAANATVTIIDITKKLGAQNAILNELSELVYQLGYIEGLSYMPEEDDELQN